MDVSEAPGTTLPRVQLLDMGISVAESLVSQNVGAEVATPVAVSAKVKQVFDEPVISRLYEAKSSGQMGKYG